MNIFLKKTREMDLILITICNIRSRTHHVFKSQNAKKTNKTFDLLGWTHTILKKCIDYQLFGNMSLENYSLVWEIDL